MSNVLIKVENVKKSFKIGNSEIEILKGISFEIQQGDFAVIFGPSGSGKSTLLHVLLGLEIPTTGNVTFLGESLYEGKDEDQRSSIRKKHVGMVYQQPNWIKSLNVVENVAFPLILLGVEKAESVKQAWKQLDQINLQKWVSYIPTELSGGQQQRVALARALITNPSVIIADEPTGNLDFQAGQDLMDLLMKLNGQGRTIIMVTHDLEYLKFAKRAIQILDGRVVAMFDETNKDKMMENIKGKRGIETQIGDKTVTVGDSTSATATVTASSTVVSSTVSAPVSTQPTTPAITNVEVKSPVVVEQPLMQTQMEETFVKIEAPKIEEKKPEQTPTSLIEEKKTEQPTTTQAEVAPMEKAPVQTEINTGPENHASIVNEVRDIIQKQNLSNQNLNPTETPQAETNVAQKSETVVNKPLVSTSKTHLSLDNTISTIISVKTGPKNTKNNKMMFKNVKRSISRI